MNKQHYVFFMLEKTKPLASTKKLFSDVMFYLMCMLISSVLIYVNAKHLILSIAFVAISLVLLYPFLRQKSVVLKKIYIMANITKEEMLKVSGVGENKFGKYGRQFLECITEFEMNE